MTTDAQLRDQALAELAKTTVGRINSKWKTPPAGTHWANAEALLAQIGAAAPPPPPPASWVVAQPVQPPHTIAHAPGAAVNLHTASDPMTVTDTVTVGGHDQAFLVQPGAPGRTFQRCRAENANGDGASVDHDHLHAFYVKAPNTKVFDFWGSASPESSNGFSVRFPGFVGQRSEFHGFPIPYAVFSDTDTPGLIVFEQGRADFGTVGVYLDVDEAAKFTHTVRLVGLDLTGGSWFLNANAKVLGAQALVEVTGCTLKGRAVSRSDCNGVPAVQLKVS